MNLEDTADMIYELPPKGKEGKSRWKPHLVRPMLVMVHARKGERGEALTYDVVCSFDVRTGRQNIVELQKTVVR